MFKKVFFLVGVLLFAITGKAQDYQKIEYLITISQYENARTSLKSILKDNPSDAKAFYLMGETYFKQGKPDSANIFYKKGIEADSKSGLNLVGQGKLIYLKDVLEGENFFQKALSVSKSKETDVPLAIASFYVEKANSPDKALSLLQEIAKHGSKDPQYFIETGDAWLLKNDGSKALENYERRALPLNPENPSVYSRIGHLYTRTRNYDMAMKYFNQAIEKDAQYAPAYQQIAEVYYKAGLYSKAIKAYEKYQKIADQDPDSDFRYASFVFLNKDYEDAIAILKSVADKHRNNPILFRLLGYSYYETGKNDLALQNMNQFFKKAEPKQILSSDYQYLAKILNKQGETEAAIENYDKAIEKDSSNRNLFIEKGNIYFLNKQFKEAAASYDKKLSHTKGSANDYLNYGKMLFYDQQFSRADSVFDILIEILPSVPHGYLWKAKSQEQLDPEMKEGLAEAAYKKFTEVADEVKYKNDLIYAYSYLGSWYAQQNDMEQAASAWKKVQELDPANANAKEALKNYK